MNPAIEQFSKEDRAGREWEIQIFYDFDCGIEELILEGQGKSFTRFADGPKHPGEKIYRDSQNKNAYYFDFAGAHRHYREQGNSKQNSAEYAEQDFETLKKYYRGDLSIYWVLAERFETCPCCRKRNAVETQALGGILDDWTMNDVRECAADIIG